MWLFLEVDDIKDAGTEKLEYREIEGILFRDEKGNERKFKAKAMMNETVKYMKHLFSDVDWNANNMHVCIVLGEEIKE